MCPAAVPVDHYATITYECDMDIDHNDIRTDMLLMSSALTASHQLIGVTGPPDTVEAFLSHVADAYPGLNSYVRAKYQCEAPLPPLAPLFKVFESADALNAYMVSKNYTKDGNEVCSWGWHCCR